MTRSLRTAGSVLLVILLAVTGATCGGGDEGSTASAADSTTTTNPVGDASLLRRLDDLDEKVETLRGLVAREISDTAEQNARIGAIADEARALGEIASDVNELRRLVGNFPTTGLRGCVGAIIENWRASSPPRCSEP